jgi:hypothetical protein
MSDVLTLEPDDNNKNKEKDKGNSMPHIQFSDRDLLRGKVVEPGWYLVSIDNIGEAPSKDGGSTNYPIEGKIVKNADTGSEEFAGVPLDWNFNSKAIGFAVGFLAAFGVTVTAGQRFELANAIGKYVEVFVENGEWQGRIVNRVNHKYRAVRS